MLQVSKSKLEKLSSKVNYDDQQIASYFEPAQVEYAATQFRKAVDIIYDSTKHRYGLVVDSQSSTAQVPSFYTQVGKLPPIYPEWLGDRSFQVCHKLRFPYICGAMANGISSVELVVAAAQAGLLAFFGSAGLSYPKVKEAIVSIKKQLGDKDLSWGSNLIHSPNEPHLEQALVDLYLKEGVKKISASAFMQLSPAIVRYACSGLSYDGKTIHRRNRVFAKISRPELARQFMSAAPKKILLHLVKENLLTPQEAKLAEYIPLSEDISVEADSAGHTDNQVLGALFPAVVSVRNKVLKSFKLKPHIRIGAAGGIGSPAGVAAAFTMGAAYVLTGSVNQACNESGLDPVAKRMLSKAGFGDMGMCAAADMFEQGVKLQVLKRGSFYVNRANWLYELYKSHSSLDELSLESKQRLQKEIFHASLDDVWKSTQEFWSERDPSQVEQALKDKRHKMALVFRSYLGQASRWAIVGEKNRQMDYQIWCGPAMAAFNEWSEGTFLEEQKNRSVAQVAWNLLEGAAKITRAAQLRSYGISVPELAFDYQPQCFVLPT